LGCSVNAKANPFFPEDAARALGVLQDLSGQLRPEFRV